MFYRPGCCCCDHDHGSILQIECDACCYDHPADQMIGVEVHTAAGKKRLSLCRHHVAPLLQRLAQGAGEHPTLMEILKAREVREERRAIARGERVTPSDMALERGFKCRG